MKLIDAVRTKKGKVVVQGCSRNDLPEFFKEMGYKVGAEIGVLKGRLTQKFCLAGMRMFAVDPWMVYPDWDEKVGHFGGKQEDQEGLFKIAQWRLSRYRQCTIIKKESMEAAKDIEDGSLDFVYIDGNHSFKYIAQDICEWSKKVRVGGMVSGHDYKVIREWNCHVKQVVDAYVSAHMIKDWYIFGSPIDNIPSWMWVKE